jgi:hypothetical protein
MRGAATNYVQHKLSDVNRYCVLSSAAASNLLLDFVQRHSAVIVVLADPSVGPEVSLVQR